MLRFTRRSLIVLVLSLILMGSNTAMAVAAPGGNAAASAACEDDGYLRYTDAEGNAFKNAGQCTRYAARGETLKSAPFLTIVWEDELKGGEMYGLLTGSGLRPGESVWVTVTYKDGSGDTHVTREKWIDSVGNLYAEYGYLHCEYSSMVFWTYTWDGKVIEATAPLPC